jgi:uncharacterized protein
VKQLTNKSKNLILVAHVEQAKSMASRLKGLLGRDSLKSDQTLWLEPCNSIHTFFMKFAIDVVFVDKNLVVRKVVLNLPPWRLLAPVIGAQSVFEFAAGVLDTNKISPGDQLHVGH